jgi:hypothetical protein
MGRISTAFRAFFAALGNAETAARIEAALSGKPAALPSEPPPPPKIEKPVAPLPVKAPTQNPAVTLLAALQREARLIDFLQEDLSGYADEQIGSAVRDVHRDSRKVLDRFFALRPVLAKEEGAVVDVAADHDPGKYRLTGKANAAAQQGTLQHHGWEATRCELPQFTGSPSAANVVAPAEIDVN